jgi:hypothetical protein
VESGSIDKNTSKALKNKYRISLNNIHPLNIVPFFEKA